MLITAMRTAMPKVTCGKITLWHPSTTAESISTRTQLQWFQARSGTLLPSCGCVSVSIWWYRFLMLLWALWLAVSVLRWLATAWKAFGSGDYFRPFPGRNKAGTPPPPPIPAG